MSDICSTLIELGEADWAEQAFAALRAEKQRSTSPRKAIIGWIAAQQRPFSAEALTTALHGCMGVGRATVYRTVDWLRDNGWLARIQTARGDHTYARTLPGHHHHAVCTHCGATLLVEGCAALDSLANLLANHGFVVQGHMLEIFGICARCRGTTQTGV